MTIHRRATKWDGGAVPESLLTTCREHGAKAASWHALPRSGRGGYRHAGLELEVVGSEPPEAVAAAVLALVTEHSQGEDGATYYRVDAFDGTGARLNADAPLVLRIGEAGDAEDVEGLTPGAAQARWALKALNETHTRYVAVLGTIDKMVGMVGECLDAMAGAVASAAQARMDFSAGEAEREAEQRKHEKQMKLLEWLMAQQANARGAGPQSSGGPLGAWIASLATEQRETVRECIGADLWGDLLRACEMPAGEERRTVLTALLERITPAMQGELARKLPASVLLQLQLAAKAEGVIP